MGKKIEIKIKKDDPNAIIPRYAKDGDVGMDVFAVSCKYNEEYDYYEYDTGLICESGREIGWFMFPRSSNSKTEYYLCNGVGTIDSFGYRGHIKARWKNRTSLDQMINNAAFMRIIDTINCGRKADVVNIFDSVRKEYLERAHNLEFAPYRVSSTEAIAQLIAFDCRTVNIIEGELIMNTERGTGGFGSTTKIA